MPEVEADAIGEPVIVDLADDPCHGPGNDIPPCRDREAVSILGNLPRLVPPFADAVEQDEEPLDVLP